jgi:hypothetical protein
MKFYFRCTENPKAPPTTVDTEWEAAEFRRHPFYEEISAAGDVIARPPEAVKVEIPFTPGNTEPVAPTKRAILKMPNKRAST